MPNWHTRAACPAECHVPGHQAGYIGGTPTGQVAADHAQYVAAGHKPNTRKAHKKYLPKADTDRPWQGWTAAECNSSTNYCQLVTQQPISTPPYINCSNPRIHSNSNNMVHIYNSVNIAHTVAPLTAHLAPISCQPPPHINSVNYYATLCTQKPDVSDDATVC